MVIQVEQYQVFSKQFYYRNTIESTEEKVEKNAIEDFAHFNRIEVDEICEHIIDEKKVIYVGFLLIKTVRKMDMSFATMITTTYFTCILLATGMFYSASTILFGIEEKELILSSTASMAVALLCLFRLCWLTYCGYILTETMRVCSRLLDKLKFNNKEVSTDEVELLRRDLRYHSESPITPFMAFSLSTSTLVTAVGTIVTYLIVLLQFKVSE